MTIYIDDETAHRLILERFRWCESSGWNRDRRMQFYGFVNAAWLAMSTSCASWAAVGKLLEATITAAYTVRDES